MTSPVGRRRLLSIATDRGLSKRRACELLGLSRAVAQYRLRQPEKDRSVVEAVVETSQRFPRFGYRRTAAWLEMGETRVRRLWRLHGLQLPKRRRKLPRLVDKS